MKTQWTISNVLLTILKYFILIFLVFVFLTPVVVMLFAAFKTGDEFAATGVLDLPKNILNFANFKTAIEEGQMVKGLANTGIILFFSLIGSVLCGSMVAYVFSRFQSKFNTVIKGMFLLSVMIPGVVSQIV